MNIEGVSHLNAWELKNELLQRIVYASVLRSTNVCTARQL